jgi:hypothetical protein
MINSKNSKLLMITLVLSLILSYIYLSQYQKQHYKSILSFMSKYRESIILGILIILLLLYVNYSNIKTIAENFIDFEYNILNSSDIKDTVTQIELEAVNDLNEIGLQRLLTINQDFSATNNLNLNGRLRSMIPLIKSRLLTVPSAMCTISATYGYQKIQNEPNTIKQLLLENYRIHFEEIANNVFNKSIALLVPESSTKKDDLVNDNGELIEDLSVIEIDGIITIVMDEYKDKFNKIYFEKLLNKIREIKYTAPEDISIYDAIGGINPTHDLIKHNQVFSNFANKIIENQDIKFNNTNFGRFNEVLAAIKEYNKTIDNERTNQITNLETPNPENVKSFSEVFSPLILSVENQLSVLNKIPQKNDNITRKVEYLNKLNQKAKNTVDDYDFMVNYADFKNVEIELINNKLFPVYVKYLFFNEDNTINFRNVAIRLFMIPREYNKSLERLEEMKKTAQNRSKNAENTKTDLNTGIINKDLNLPVGYFKIGLKLPNKSAEMYLTVESNPIKSTDIIHQKTYNMKLSPVTSDKDLKQLFYADIDGRIYNMDKKLALTIVPNSGDPKKIENNDKLILAMPEEMTKPSQIFKFSKNFERISMVRSENVVKDLYLTFDNESMEIRLGEFIDDPRQNKWFTKLIGEYKDQRSVFGKSQFELTRNARQPLDVSVGTIPPNNTYTYSFWTQVNNQNKSSGKLPLPILVKGNVVSPDLDDPNKLDNVSFYRAPGVFLKYSPENTHYDLKVVLSTDKNLREEFDIIKPDILRTTNDQTVWDHIELIVHNKGLIVYINGNKEYEVNTVGTVIQNPYSLKVTPGGGFSGKIHFLRYYNYKRNPSEVRQDMFETAPADLVFGNIPVRELVSDDKYQPEADYDHYGPNSARLHSSYGWLPYLSSYHEIKNIAGTFYIQANFDSSSKDPGNNFYTVQKMYIQGHGDTNAFIKRFRMSYYDHVEGDWKDFRNEELLVGVDSALSFNTLHNLNFVTNKVRIYPMEWNTELSAGKNKHKLGLRVGFNGKPTKPSRCDRKVSICEIDKMRLSDKSDRADVGSRLHTSTARLSISENRQKKLEFEINNLHKELNKSRIEKNLCNKPNKPDAKCLPNTLTLVPSKCDAVYSYSNSVPAKAPKTLTQEQINKNVNFDDYELKNKVKYGALCDHLVKVSPERYKDHKQCVEKLEKRISGTRKNN